MEDLQLVLSSQKQKNKISKRERWLQREENHLEMLEGIIRRSRWLDRLEKKRWTGEEQALLWVKKKGSEHGIGVSELDGDVERGDSCHVSRWLSSGTQRQNPFSNPIVSAGCCHPALLRNPVNMHPIPSHNHTHNHPARIFKNTHATEFLPHTELLPHTNSPKHTWGHRKRSRNNRIKWMCSLPEPSKKKKLN